MADEMKECVSSSKSNENTNSRIEYNPKKLIGVEYPGLVQNASRMIETLGGEESISKVFSGPTRRLALSFRPEDPYSKIVCGDPQPTTNLLLRVRRRKKKSTSVESADDNFEYKQEVLGVVDKTYRFGYFADYQYLPRDNKYPLDSVHGLDILEEDTPMHILPPMFTRVETAANYHFKPDLQPHPPQEEKELNNTGALPKMRIRQPIYAFAISFETEEVPQKPHEKVPRIVDLVKDNQVEVIQKLFNIRPIWSRTALEAHMTQVKYGRLKQLLSLVAYYFLNGPWRTLWVKFGYDPRKNPSAKMYIHINISSQALLRNKEIKPKGMTHGLKWKNIIPKPRKSMKYQMLDFRIGSRTEGKKLPIPRKRNFHRISIPVLRKANVKQQVTLGTDQNPEDENKSQQDDDLPYVFTTNKLPMHKQMFFQLCDLHVSEIQELISANDGQETECHEKEGWCLPGTIDKIRDIMVQHTVKLVEKVKKQQEEEDVQGQESEPIEWGGHEEVKSFLEMLEGDDDIETYDIFDEDSDNDVDPQDEGTT